MRVFVTGGSGFIGSNFIIRLLSLKKFRIMNFDKLTYAGNKENLKRINSSNYTFVKGDIYNKKKLEIKINEFKPNYIIHFAAESHVDNSISSSLEFIQTNIVGTYNLLECAKNYYNKLTKKNKKMFKFHHISTDEVYGDMEEELFHENSQYRPSSPYSASKASSDHLVRSWQRTFDLPTIITNCSNNYGPFQYPEKLIPVVIINALKNKKIPVYGNGRQVRDWIYVSDHCDALINCMKYASVGETYNIGSSSQVANIDLVNKICEYLDEIHPKKNSYKKLIEFVKDRPGHDKIYGIDNRKAIKNLFWKPRIDLQKGLKLTVQWYLNNEKWWAKLIT